MVIVLQWQVKEGCLPLPHPFPTKQKKKKIKIACLMA